ncbi:hypothetical protein [Taklimakanibacter lacteus]|uniref:hypothetical protein n=1 Tax=Taklimakanibacter lacteus TaxID=2268456 RepID=UPI0034D5AAC8
MELEFDDELEDELELELEELFELEFDDELEELFELELEELFELEFDDELEELFPARMIWPLVPVTLCMPSKSGLATVIACAAPVPRPKARAPRITLRFMLFPFIKVASGSGAHSIGKRASGAAIPRS